MRCPVGFVEESDGTFTIYYTVMTHGFFKGFEGLGKVRVRVHEELPPEQPLASGDGIANKYISLRVSKTSGLAEVVDLRSREAYRLKPAFDAQGVSEVHLSARDKGWTMEAAFKLDNAPVSIRYRLSPESPELAVTMNGVSLSLPIPFPAGGLGFQWILPIDYGMLCSADDGNVSPATLAKACSLHSWLGLSHSKSGQGC